MRRAVPAPEPDLELRLGGVGPSSAASIAPGPSSSELLARERHPGRLGDPASSVAPVERGLDERRVGDRARDAIGLLIGGGTVDADARDARLAPSPSATISSAS